jgi:predicted NAD/FAD-binding protein
VRIAVVGSGISGLMCSWLLSRRHSVTLFEANDYLGGHTHTHDIVLRGREYRVDTGFIVFSPLHYPLLTRLFQELHVDSQPTTMSFSVRNEASGLEYNATNLAGMFCQRRNLVSPRFLGMIRDLMRFYREAPALLALEGRGPTLGEYLEHGRYGAAFRDEHLVPMAAALWSSPPAEILSFPALYLVRFMANHQMLNVQTRPVWRVVAGGSDRYVAALRARWSVEERPGCPVRRVARGAQSVQVTTDRGVETFDQVVFACHSDQALSLLDDPSPAERDVLGALRYQSNEVVLHTDASVLPLNRRAWAAWNALVPRVATQTCTVSYCMNLLQGIPSPDPLIVTLNPVRPIDPEATLRKLRYHHPVYSHESVAAQARRPEIQGMNRTWFAGAYWGWGFHEDGMRSAVEVAAALGAPWDLEAPGGNVLPMSTRELAA